MLVSNSNIIAPQISYLCSVLAASANLTEDFFLTHVLKHAADESLKFLRTSYFLQIMDKFKDNTEECVRIAQLTVDQIDPTDDRISLLWNKVRIMYYLTTVTLHATIFRFSYFIWIWKTTHRRIPR